MKYLFCFSLVLFLSCCCLKHHYDIYQYDNGNDHVSEGTIRIIDKKNKKIGYATASGKVIISPRYAFGFPFKNGKAKVTYSGHNVPVQHSDREYHYWKSNDWFYIDKTGKVIK